MFRTGFHENIFIVWILYGVIRMKFDFIQAQTAQY